MKNRGDNENAAFSTDTILHMGNTINTGLNTFNRLAPGLLKKTSRKVNWVAERRIWQIIQEGGGGVKRVVVKS